MSRRAQGGQASHLQVATATYRPTPEPFLVTQVGEMQRGLPHLPCVPRLPPRSALPECRALRNSTSALEALYPTLGPTFPSNTERAPRWRSFHKSAQL